MRADTSTETIRAVIRAQETAIAAGTDASARGLDFVGRALADAAATESHRRREVSAAERRLDDAQHALARCEGARPPLNCSGPAAEVSAARQALDDARARLDDARRAVSAIQQAQDAFRTAARTAQNYFNGRARGGIREAAAFIGALDQYSSSASAGAGGGGGGSGGAGAAAPSGALGTTGCELVDLANIDDSDSRVGGPGDFRESFSHSDAVWATEELQGKMIPAVQAGRDRDYFVGRDRAEGRSADRSYARLYDTWFGDDRAIKLSRNNSGKFEVTNGYHRIFVARQLGIPAVPARVRGGS